ncbi:MAG TPA: tautomerase family protein [Victivallales bacterium]|nr:tautomerase family protein [Victivallales bacterium]
MPHITIKLIEGKTEKQKQLLTKKIIEDVVEIAKCNKKVVSVAFED